MPSTRVSRTIPLPSSPLKFEKDASKLIEKQGIVTILGSDFEVNKVAPSLRRTISADMSSKKWLSQNGFASMKRIASSGELAAASASLPEGDDDEVNIPGQDDVWRSIQLQKEKNEHEKTAQLGVWSSILTEKTNESNNVELPPPYIHPLLKRSSSILSEKSLEICTESLGSETGSEVFSSNYLPSKTDDTVNTQQQQQQQQEQQQQQQQKDSQTQSFNEFEVTKYNYKPTKKMAPRSFPPPLPSIARGDGPSLHMQSQRQDGRLIVQAVSVPQQNYFHVKRQQGRLLLTLVNCPTSQLKPGQEEMRDDKPEVFDNFEEVEMNDVIEDEEEEAEEELEEGVENEKGIKEMTLAIEKSSTLPSAVTINVHSSALMMKSLIGLHNKDRTWSIKLNKAVNLIEVETLTQIPQSLPPKASMVPRVIPSSSATTASFNAYEYIWRNKPAMTSIINPVTQQCTPLKDNEVDLAKSNNQWEYEQQDMVLIRNNKADYFVPFLRGCKERRRSLLFWQHYCIATS